LETNNIQEFLAEVDFFSPTDDYMFKLLFGTEQGIEQLTDFLKSVLKLSAEEYDEITIVDPHLPRTNKDDKLGVLDVTVRTKSGRLIDVEIQVKPSPELRERVAFYGAKMLSRQIKAGNNHIKLKPVIVVLITSHVLAPEEPKYHNRNLICNPDTGVIFTDILEIHTIELPKIPKNQDDTELWWWAKFLSAQSKEEMNMLAAQNPQIGKVVVRYMELSADEQTRMIMESRHKLEWDNQARKRAEIEQIVKNLLGMGDSVEKIARATGYPIEDIVALQ
jgi:predicted transposase/invertase (TIGR01784 family)